MNFNKINKKSERDEYVQKQWREKKLFNLQLSKYGMFKNQ